MALGEPDEVLHTITVITITSAHITTTSSHRSLRPISKLPHHKAHNKILPLPNLHSPCNQSNRFSRFNQVNLCNLLNPDKRRATLDNSSFGSDIALEL